MTKLGYQIPNFSYPNMNPTEVFTNVIAQAKAAEQSGFDSVMVMDHFYQLPALGDPDQFMIEAYTVLAAIAQHTNGSARCIGYRQHVPKSGGTR